MKQRSMCECLEVQSPNINPTDKSNKVNKRTLSDLSFGDWDVVARFRILEFFFWFNFKMNFLGVENLL